jgi:NMT1-like family
MASLIALMAFRSASSAVESEAPRRALMANRRRGSVVGKEAMSHGSLWVDSMNRCGAAVPPDKSGRSAPTGLVPGSQVTERSAGTGLVVKGVVLVFATMLLILAPRAFAQDEPILAIAVGGPGSPSYKFGLGLSSLFQAAALPDGTKMRIEIWESLSSSERIAVLLEEVQLAVIHSGEVDREDRRARQLIRAAVGLPDGSQVLVRADLRDDLVYNITRLVFEHSDLMRSAYPEVGALEPSASLMRIQGAAHPGALRYYEEQQELQLPPALPPQGSLLISTH